MIRLVATNSEDSPWREINSRLTDATLQPGALSRCLDHLDACDAVVFLGPIDLDQLRVDQLLKAGKHVLLAGEPCWPWEVLEALSASAHQAGVQFAVVNPDRYLPSRQLIKQQIPGKIGEPGLIRIHRWEPASLGQSPGPLGVPGPLVRDIDLVSWLIGKSPTLVYALEHPGRFVQVHLGFSAGMALIDFDQGLPAREGYHSLSVVGFSGSAYSDDHQNMQLLYRAGQLFGVPTGEGIVHLTALVQEFARALAHGREKATPPRSTPHPQPLSPEYKGEGSKSSGSPSPLRGGGWGEGFERDLSQSVSDWRQVLAVADSVKQSLLSRRAISVEGRT